MQQGERAACGWGCTGPSSHVVWLAQVEAVGCGGGYQPRDLRVPVHLLHVALPAVHKQQLRRQVVGRQRVVLGRQRRLLLGVALQGQVPHRQLVVCMWVGGGMYVRLW